MRVGLSETQKLRSGSEAMAKMQKMSFCNGDGRHLRDRPTVIELGINMLNRQR